MSRPPGVSVVIPTVDREASLARALASVARAATRVSEPVEAIVVDDSQPARRERPTRWCVGSLPVRRVWTADASVKGPAAARNLGVSLAAYDVIAFTDDDTVCADGWLVVGVGRLRADPILAGVEGAVRLDPASAIDPIRVRLVMNLRGGGFLTASMFLRAEAIEAAGGFRRLRADGEHAWAIPYREDSDLALRVVREVGPIPFAPDAYVLHPAEAVDLRRLVRLARYFVVDGAFARLHPEACPPIHRRPLARARIRAASAIVLLLPGLLPGRTRRPVAIMIAALTAAVSAQVDFELRQAGLRRPPLAAARDTIRRLPRALLWSLVAGSARLEGEALLALGIVELPDDAERPRDRSR